MKQIRDKQTNQQYLIGTSFSACVRDIIEKRVRMQDVCFLMTCCKFRLQETAEENIDFMINEHARIYGDVFRNIDPGIRAWLVLMYGTGNIIGRERLEVKEEHSRSYFPGVYVTHPSVRSCNWFSAVQFTPKRTKKGTNNA
jgi:hypothetical protein